MGRAFQDSQPGRCHTNVVKKG